MSALSKRRHVAALQSASRVCIRRQPSILAFFPETPCNFTSERSTKGHGEACSRDCRGLDQFDCWKINPIPLDIPRGQLPIHQLRVRADEEITQGHAGSFTSARSSTGKPKARPQMAAAATGRSRTTMPAWRISSSISSPRLGPAYNSANVIQLIAAPESMIADEIRFIARTRWCPTP